MSTGYTVKVRGGGGLVCREFACPDHGVFDVLVERNHGQEQVPQPCPRHVDIGGGFAAPCHKPSEPVMSAPTGRVRLGEVSRGKVEKAPTPLHLDTEAIADGMSPAEFKARRRKLWADHDRATSKKEGMP